MKSTGFLNSFQRVLVGNDYRVLIGRQGVSMYLLISFVTRIRIVREVVIYRQPLPLDDAQGSPSNSCTAVAFCFSFLWMAAMVSNRWSDRFTRLPATMRGHARNSTDSFSSMRRLFDCFFRR